MRIFLASLAALLAIPSAFAVPFHSGETLKRAPEIKDISSKKEFFISFEGGMHPYKAFQVFLIAREIEDPERKGWFDYEFVGRAAVAETSVNNAHFVLYKPFKGGELKSGDRVVATGDPLTLEEMDLLRREVLGVLQRDKELEDLYTGLISLKVGLYSGSLDGSSNNDTNAFKKANSYFLKNVGIRWWLFFAPTFGLNFEFANGSIPTFNYMGKEESSSQTYLNPGVLFRSKFAFIPAIYSLTFFINKFSTTNTDDYLLSSTYSGPSLGVTFYYPYRFQLFRLGPFTFSFNNIEAGLGLAPSVQVSDVNFKRGSTVTARQLSLNAGLEFNFTVRGLNFTRDLFFVFEGGQQRYSLDFSGPTSGTLPSGALIPEGTQNTEIQTWYGVRVKYNMRDLLGELLLGL